jgi:hypothetical protein
MSAAAQRDEVRRPVLAGIIGHAAEAVTTAGFGIAPVALLPECTCFAGDCDRDHENE